MADEAILRQWQEDPMDFLVSDAVGIEKGTVLKLTDARTAIASSGNSEAPAGIARREKTADDGRIRLACFRKGIFDMVSASGATMSAGDQVVISGANLIRAALTDGTEDHLVIGRTLEDVTIFTGERVQVAVNM